MGCGLPDWQGTLSLYLDFLLPVWCVGACTRFLMTHYTIPTFVNVFAVNLFISLVSKVFMECKLYMGMLNDYGSSCRHAGTYSSH